MFSECLKRKRPWPLDCEDSPSVKVYLTASHYNPHLSIPPERICTGKRRDTSPEIYPSCKKRKAASPSERTPCPKKTLTQSQRSYTTDCKMNVDILQQNNRNVSGKTAISHQTDTVSEKTEQSINVEGPVMEGPQEFNSYNYWKVPLPDIDIEGKAAMD